MPKFLHTADWQMGRAFTRFETEDGAALVEARFEDVIVAARTVVAAVRPSLSVSS